MNDKPQSSEAEDKARKEEVAAYEKVRQYVKEALADAREAVNAETIRQAVDTGVAKAKAAGNFTAGALSKAAEAVRRDMARAAERLGPKWNAFSDKSADLFAVWRDRSSVFLGQAATAFGSWMEKMGQRLEHQSYEAGEITYGGAFECVSCHERVELAKSGHLPPCPKCAGRKFERV